MANSWGAFNPNNLGGKTLDSLRNDIYAGFRTKTKTIQGRQGKYGRGPSSTKQVFHAGYYKDHPGWRGIGDKLGININSENDVRQLFDYVNGYKPPAPKAAPASKGPTKSKGPTPFEKQVADINAKYTEDNKRLTSQIAAGQASYKLQADNFNKRFNDQQDGFNTLLGKSTADYEKRLSDAQAGFDGKLNEVNTKFASQFAKQSDDYQNSLNNLNNRVANAANAYDPTKNMGSSNNINPALSIQEKNKSLSSGTQRYNRNSGLNIKNVNL